MARTPSLPANHKIAETRLSKKLKKRRRRSNDLSESQDVEVSAKSKDRQKEANSMLENEQGGSGSCIAADEFSHVLGEDDFQESYTTDSDAEEETRKLNYSQQIVRSSDEALLLYTTPSVSIDGIESHRRFLVDVSQLFRQLKESQPDSPRPEVPSLHSHDCCNVDSEDSSSSCSDYSEESETEEGQPRQKKLRASKERQSLSLRDRRRRRRKPSDSSPIQASSLKAEVEWRRTHPASLHQELCFNVADLMNDGPVCNCSFNSKLSGIRHDYYEGEALQSHLSSSFRCEPSSLYHYVLRIDPNPSTFARKPSIARAFGSPTFQFEGLSLLLHRPLPDVMPREPATRWCIDFHFELVQAPPLPVNAFTIEELDTFRSYVFRDILELYDLKFTPPEGTNGCPIYHVFPRYLHSRPDGTKEIAPMSLILEWLREQFTQSFLDDSTAAALAGDSTRFDEFSQAEKGQIITNPCKKPSAIRADVIDKASYLPANTEGYPIITHFTSRPSAYMLYGRPEYQHAVSLLARLKEKARAEGATAEDKENLAKQHQIIVRMRSECVHKRDASVSFSSKGFRRTGLMPDITHHALILSVAVGHVRFHWSLQELETRLGYSFHDRSLAELAFSHPSYTANYGMNADQARNTLANCGVRIMRKKRVYDNEEQRLLDAEIRELKSGQNKRKGMAAIFDIMMRARNPEKLQISPMMHNERLEFLGDVVVEVIVTVHLFFLLPEHDEGALATFRSALVQNKHLAHLAERLGLDKFMLYSHGADLCHVPEMRHAMANAFEALMAAIFLDSRSIDHCERIYGEALFQGEDDNLRTWRDLRDHKLKCAHPGGDRHLIDKAPALRLIAQFEREVGLHFQHIRLLAKAFTRRAGAHSNLTMGDNQSLELLGDTVLQLAATEFLYKRFPLHHEGHLSLLRTCLVSNKTQSLICDDLQMHRYIVMTSAQRERGLPKLRVKDKADLVEALLGAMFVDRGWEYCKAFCRTCFFPRLKYFIQSQKWNDPKSQLQQLCLSIPRKHCESSSLTSSMPEYKTVAVHGPTNTREYKIAVFFRGKRLAMGNGNTMHAAQMRAASEGLAKLPELFPDEWESLQKKRKRNIRGGNKERERSSSKMTGHSASHSSDLLPSSRHPIPSAHPFVHGTNSGNPQSLLNMNIPPQHSAVFPGPFGVPMPPIGTCFPFSHPMMISSIMRPSQNATFKPQSLLSLIFDKTGG